jgi:hypothetical protein
MAAWTCSGAAIASHALMSGKFNEFMSLFVGEADAPPCRTDQGLVETQTTAWPGHFGSPGFPKAYLSG